MERSKGYFIKQSFSNDFVDYMEELYKKYGEEIFEIQGIANKYMDICQFSRDFFGNSTCVADVSVDANANVREKNVTQYNFENNKAVMRLNSLYMMYKKIKEIYDVDSAKIALDKVISGELFVNDLHTYASMPYCFAFDLRNLITNGMNFYHGNMNIGAPKRSDSFIALLIQSTAYISNQIAGAASYPDFFPILDWFYRKELGENYAVTLRTQHDTDTGDRTMWNKVKNQFQNLIYSLNFPFRGGQSAFTNLSIMDHGFMKSLFHGYQFPDFTEPNVDSSIELSKLFFEYFTDINCNEGMFTFPVTTIAISLDENKNYIDPDFVDWSAGVNCKKALANIFQDKPTSFSSCCRLKNDFSKIADMGYQNSFGVGGLSIGSHRVAGLNMPRIAILEKDNPNILEEDLNTVHKILYAHRQLMKERIDGGYLPLYTNHWIELNRQYSTVGFVGGYEYVANKGLDIETEDGSKSLQIALKKIENKEVEWQSAESDEKNIYNIEQIPAESMAVRLADIDFILGYNNVTSKEGNEINHKFPLYSNQYIPLISKASIYDRFRLQGNFDSLTSGGAILHINVDDEHPISKDQFKRLMNAARKLHVVYYAINYAYSQCSDMHFIIGRAETCPICGAKITQQFTRVVGFITPVKSWNKTRRLIEYPNRVFYHNGALNIDKEMVTPMASFPLLGEKKIAPAEVSAVAVCC